MTANAPPVRVLITGSRELTDRSIVAGALQQVVAKYPGSVLTVVHGAARGADRIASSIARMNPTLMVEEAHPVSPAEWEASRGAGFARNARMIALGADVCLAFFHASAANRGTAHAAGNARKAGIVVWEFWQPAE